MWNLLKSLGNFYLYSSLHIAICAALLTFESFYVLNKEVQIHYVLFIGLSTMAVYSAHRLVGMSKVKAFDDQGRYKVIKKFRHHILVYFCISLLLASYFFFKIDFRQMLMLFTPVLLTAAYILPVFKSRRLRDLPFIKIFLIAIVWTWLTLNMVGCDNDSSLCMYLSIERILFFIAITIPFDIRDLEVDRSISVKTLIHSLGINNSKFLAAGLIFICFFLMIYLGHNGLISSAYLYGLILTYLYVLVLIFFSRPGKADYYYGGLLDGSIGLRILLCLGVEFLFLN